MMVPLSRLTTTHSQESLISKELHIIHLLRPLWHLLNSFQVCVAYLTLGSHIKALYFDECN